MPIGQFHDLAARGREFDQPQVAGHTFQRVGLVTQQIPVARFTGFAERGEMVVRFSLPYADVDHLPPRRVEGHGATRRS